MCVFEREVYKKGLSEELLISACVDRFPLSTKRDMSPIRQSVLSLT